VILAYVGLVIVLVFCSVIIFGAPYVPTRRRDISTAFDKLYKVGAQDTVLDIGSGDGLVLRAAARRGARAIGYEINTLSWF
jgi:tRNA G46 methylase TrmB